jgi:hypothetical protein
VAFNNCWERTRECSRCVHWQSLICIRFDIGIDALWDPTSIRVARGGGQVRLFPGFLCTIILHPGGAKSVLL